MQGRVYLLVHPGVKYFSKAYPEEIMFYIKKQGYRSDFTCGERKFSSKDVVVVSCDGPCERGFLDNLRRIQSQSSILLVGAMPYIREGEYLFLKGHFIFNMLGSFKVSTPFPYARFVCKAGKSFIVQYMDSKKLGLKFGYIDSKDFSEGLLAKFLKRILRGSLPVASIYGPAITIKNRKTKFDILIKNLPKNLLYNLELLADGLQVYNRTLSGVKVFRFSTPIVFSKEGPVNLELFVNKKRLCSKKVYVLPSKRAFEKADYGFFAFPFYAGSDSLLDAYLELLLQMRELGANHVRIVVSWPDLQPCYDSFDFAKLDKILNKAAKLRYRIIPFVQTAPTDNFFCPVPNWLVKEPAVDQHGVPARFPTLWGSFHRQAVFELHRKIIQRYKNCKSIEAWGLDIGMTDNPYHYQGYPDPNVENFRKDSVYDFSCYEKEAFEGFNRIEGNMPVNRFRRISLKKAIEFLIENLKSIDSRGFWVLYQNTLLDVNGEAPIYYHSGSIGDLDTSAAFTAFKKEYLCGEHYILGTPPDKFHEALFQAIRYNAKILVWPGIESAVFPQEFSKFGFVFLFASAFKKRISPVAVFSPNIQMFDVNRPFSERPYHWSNKNSLARIFNMLDYPVENIDERFRDSLNVFSLIVLNLVHPEDVSDVWKEKILRFVASGGKLLVFPQAFDFVSRIFGLKIEAGKSNVSHLKGPLGVFDSGYEVFGVNLTNYGKPLLFDGLGQQVFVEVPFSDGKIFVAGFKNYVQDEFKNHKYFWRKSVVRAFFSYLKLQPVLDTGWFLSPKEVLFGRDGLLVCLFNQTEDFLRQKIWLSVDRNIERVTEILEWKNRAFYKKSERISFGVDVPPGQSRYYFVKFKND